MHNPALNTSNNIVIGLIVPTAASLGIPGFLFSDGKKGAVARGAEAHEGDGRSRQGEIHSEPLSHLQTIWNSLGHQE